MPSRIRRALVIAAFSVIAMPALALASAALKGRTYRGTTSAQGTESEGNTVPVPAVPISLQVSRSGTTVTVRFLSTTPILYCGNHLVIHSQVTKPVRISGSGSFHARIGEKFAAGPGETAVTQVVTGKFSGHRVTGKVRTEPECGGVTSFTATAR